MQTTYNLVRWKSSPLSRRMPLLTQEREIMTLGAAHNWDFRTLGVAPVPATSFYFKDWWIVPLAEDTSTIPARALERVRTLYEAGIRPKAFVIAHEAPRQIAPPAETRIISPLEYWGKRTAEGAGTILKGAVAVAAVVAPVLLAMLGASLLVSLTIAGALVADPCLIAVTDDDVWIQIDYWMA